MDRTPKYFASYTDVKIETTNTPNDLFCALQGLTAAQISGIRDMGFESITSFNIHNIPMGLGHWLLANYDHKRNELSIGRRIIAITPSKVRDVLGVPMGEIVVSEQRHPRKGDIIREQWRKQFVCKRIFVKHVIQKLKSYKEGGMLFKLNFLVVFNTIMGETTRNGAVNQKFIASINNEDDISNMDWCSYIIACLKRTKEGWNGKEPYNGPLTILAVLYAHEQQLKRSLQSVITPTIQYVTTEFLVDLEGSMYDGGLCSNDKIQNVEAQVKLETHIESAEGLTAVDQNVNVPRNQEDEVQPQTDEGQTLTGQGQTDEGQTVTDQGQTDEGQPQTNEGQTDEGQTLTGQGQTDEGQTLTDEGQTYEGQPLTDEGQTAIDQTVNVPQDEEVEDQCQSTNLDSVLNLKLPIGPPSAQALSEPPRDKKLHDDDADVVILNPKQEHCELVENVSRVSDSVEKFSSDQSGVVCVQGYKVKRSVANILKAIFKKHGDIAAECILKTDSMRSSLLEAVCEVAMRVQADDVTEKLEEIESQVSDAKAVNIDVSWLEAHLEAIHKRKEASEMYTLLMKMKADHVSVKKVAQINLRKRRAELADAEERSREAKRRVGALHLVGKNLTDNFLILR